MKTCKRCKQEKPLEDFYKHKGTKDGRLSFCKECKKLEQRGRYEEKMQDPEWVAKERKRCREKNKRLDFWPKYKAKLTEEKRKRLNEVKYEWRKRNPEKQRAHNAVKRGLDSGKLEREPCAVCGKREVEAHHHDYSKPLEVVWLCRKHHAEIHRLED